MSGSERVGLPPGFAPALQPGVADRRPTGDEAGPSLGSFRGETVAVTESPLSMLENAAEELTFGAHERMTQRELGERPLEETGPRTLARVERIKEYLENLPDLDQNDIERLMKRLLQAGRDPKEALGEAIEGFHEDVTYQQAALELMDGMLEGSDAAGAAALREAVQARIAANDRASAPAIQAGLNVTPTAMLATSDAGEVQELRNLYRESVLSHESLGRSWQNIVERYGDGDIGGRIGFLLKAIGADLASRGPSIPPVELKAILDETHQLETLSTLRERAIGFFKRLQGRFGEA